LVFQIATSSSELPVDAADEAVIVEVIVEVSVTVVAVFVAYRPNPAAAIIIRTIVTPAKTVVETAVLFCEFSI